MPLNMTGKRVAVIGSRTFEDKARLYEVLNKNRAQIKLIVSGGASGPDTFSTDWAKDYGVPYLVFPALWHDPETGAFDKGAGFRRNRYIVEHSDIIIAFWDGVSRGTKNSLDTAEQLGKPVKIISFVPVLETPPIVKSDELKVKTDVSSPKEASSPHSEHVEKNENQFPALEKTLPPIDPASLLETTPQKSIGDDYSGVDEVL